MQAVETGELALVPDTHKAVWKHWLEQKQPWCISRQLWWGHRIPAWRVAGAQAGAEPDVWFVARDENEAKQKVGVEGGGG
jgi:valyl-tRNA synthetase